MTRTRSCACTSARRHQVVITSLDAPVDTMITLQPMSIVQAAADLIWSPLLRKFPDLTFALSEGGIGWIPYFLERIDRVYTMHRAWTHQDFGDKLPSEVFLERIVTCFIDDALRYREPRTSSTSTWSPGSATTRTRTRPGRSHPNRLRSTSTACPTTRSTRSPTRMLCASSRSTCSRTCLSLNPWMGDFVWSSTWLP